MLGDSFGVDSSSRFPFTARTQTHTVRRTDTHTKPQMKLNILPTGWLHSACVY